MLNFLPDETVVDDLDSLVRVDREFQSEVTKERRRRIKDFLTYGAAAVREGHEPDEGVLTSILGEEGNWKTSKYAMILVARTFSGAKHDPDGPYKFENLYPEFTSKPAFRKVYKWWRWMCMNNAEIVIKIDLLSFFLFAGENWKRHNQPQYQELDEYLDYTIVDRLYINEELLTTKAFLFNAPSSHGVQAEKQIKVRGSQTEFTLFCSPSSVDFSIYHYPNRVEDVNIFETQRFKREGYDDRLIDKFRIDKSDTALWAYACVNVLMAKSSRESLHMEYPVFWTNLHANFVHRISRSTEQDAFDSEEKHLMF